MIRARKNPPKQIILHWTASENPILKVLRNLRARNLGYHYIIDREGILYNIIDPNYVASHASEWNETSIGISLVSRGLALPNQQNSYDFMLRGTTLRILEFPSSQVDATAKICEELTRKYSIPYLFWPYDQVAPLNFRGILGHYQTTLRKIDPGPKLLKQLKERHEILQK